MQNIKSLFTLTAVILCSSLTGLAQQSISPEKKALILELRGLIEPETITLSANLSSTPSTNDPYTAQVEGDPELTDAQKQELKRFIAESNERVNKQIRDFFADKEMMRQISEEVGYQVYDKIFTDAELRELVTFYRSPTGQKAIRFMPTARSQLAKAFKEAFEQKLQEFMKPKIQKEMEEKQKKIREAKVTKNEG
jgi:hypothetical protein